MFVDKTTETIITIPWLDYFCFHYVLIIDTNYDGICSCFDHFYTEFLMVILECSVILTGADTYPLLATRGIFVQSVHHLLPGAGYSNADVGVD